MLIYYRGADKSLARPTSRCILFYGENISFDVSLVIYVNSTNIPPFMIINRIYEHQNLSLQLVSFLVGLRTYQHPCTGPLAFTSIYVAPKFKIQYNMNWGEYINVFLCTLLLRSVYCFYTLPQFVECTLGGVDATTLGSHSRFSCSRHWCTY